MKRFDGTCLITRQVRDLSNFYCMVLETAAEGDDTHMALLTDGAHLAIFSKEGMEQMAPGSMKSAGCGSYTLGFQVEDVDREYERLVQNGVEVVKPPATYPWGARSAWFRDLDGNIIDLFMLVGEQAPQNRPPETGELVRVFFQRLLNEQDVSVCDEMLSTDYIDHDASPDTPPGPQSVKAYVADFLAQYPDIHVEIEDLISTGNRAAARLVWRGTHRQTREAYHQTGIVMLRLNDQGQLVERWSAYGI
jgi:uncharacterized glyoxalase superfamily protein PhnB/predicted SnoaL-like aldol condensation-catalyzing enzyme